MPLWSSAERGGDGWQQEVQEKGGPSQVLGAQQPLSPNPPADRKPLSHAQRNHGEERSCSGAKREGNQRPSLVEATSSSLARAKVTRSEGIVEAEDISSDTKQIAPVNVVA